MKPRLFHRPYRLRFAAGPAIVSVLALALIGAPNQMTIPPALAQEANLKTLMDRIDRLQRELVTLQRQVYRGETPPAGAGASKGGDVSQPQAARIELRLSQFEQQLRALTGQLEEHSYRLGQASQRLDKLVADVDDRLQRLESGTLQPITEPEGDGAGTLGKVSAAEVAAATPTAAAAGAGVLPEGSPQEQYDHAFQLLAQTQYRDASTAFNAFVQQHPEDELAGNAKYWLGETYYVQGQYAEAAVTFAEGYQIYPESAKAPDNLLKLGKSLAALKQTEDACGTFAELIKRYSAASPTIIQQAKSERKRLSCP